MLTGTAAKDYGILPDAEEQLNPVAVERRADGEREWRCKDVFMAIIFLSGVILMAAGLANNMDGDEIHDCHRASFSCFSPFFSVAPAPLFICVPNLKQSYHRALCSVEE